MIKDIFDLNRDIGFIRDPIIPIVFDEIEILDNANQDNFNQTFIPSRSNLPPELNQSINSNIQNSIQNPITIDENNLKVQNKNNFNYSNLNQNNENLKINNLKVNENNQITIIIQFLKIKKYQ